MKKILFVAAMAVSSLSMSAQDILVRKGGDVENVKVLEVTPTEVKFKKFNNQNGPTFTERRSNLISVKYENGEVQKFNDGPAIVSGSTGRSFASDDMSYYSDYGTDKKYTNEISLYISDLWGFGYQLRREFNPYVAWNIVGISHITNFDCPFDSGILNIKALGVRGYTPSYKWIRGYADLNMGVGLNYHENYWYDETDIDVNFSLDFGFGVQVHKNIAFGYNLNYLSNGALGHMAKISFLF
ncbi:MAG: hypothetical protein K2J00_01870 [Bacteroidaceae bacterium]|nr:hypothetical protein [Bacteroidaceae bacterium]